MSNAKKRARKKGLPEGSLVYLGDKKSHKAKVIVCRVEDGVLKDYHPETIEDVKRELANPNNVWVHIAGLTDIEIIKLIGDKFNIHQLALEDIVSGVQRPKIEDYNESLFIVANNFEELSKDGKASIEQISILLFANMILTFEDGDPGYFNQVKKRVLGRIKQKKLTADYFAYVVLDTVVDSLYTILEKLGEELEQLEEKVMNEPTTQALHLSYNLKRSLLSVRRTIWPLREVLSSLERTEYEFIHESNRWYFRDVYDHAVEVLDITENLRDMTSGMIDIYLSSLSNKLNSVMKVLAAITTIFMPLTLIAGIYGMNFKYMPELEMHYAYPFVVISMLLIALVMTIFFRRKGWL